MSYSTLMVHLDLGQSNEMRLQMAGELAERFDSRLIGVAAADIQPLYFMEGGAAQDMLEKDRDRLKSQMADCEAQFRRVLKARSIISNGEAHWTGPRILWRATLALPTLSSPAARLFVPTRRVRSIRETWFCAPVVRSWLFRRARNSSGSTAS